jgi:Icc-related predicted phosphoesterase
MTTTYGIISDMHERDARVLAPTLKAMKDEEVDALIFNGDLFGERFVKEHNLNQVQYPATLMDIIGKSGMEAYILPGSHETTKVWEPVADFFTKKYGNIICALHNPKIEKEDHHLVFLPGSDVATPESANKGYVLGTDMPTGLYEMGNNGTKDVFQYTNMLDLKKMVTNPDKTILFGHIPKKFNNIESAVDVAEFGLVKEDFYADFVSYADDIQQVKVSPKKNNNVIIYRPIPVTQHIKDEYFPKDAIVSIAFASYLAKNGAPVELKKENRGNETLGMVIKNTGINKHITGHFHESAGRATDNDGNIIEAGTFVPELFYNASCMDRLMVGLVSISDGKIAYENMDLRKYLSAK